jgi:CRP-like cAMP-binding protein
LPHKKNFLLGRLDAAVLDQLLPNLSTVHIGQGIILAETHQRIEKVYFPHSGIISCVVETAGGGAIETGMIGRDGEFGASHALDEKLSLSHVVMQVPGDASVMSSNRFRATADEQPSLRALIVKYEQFFLAQVQQTAACNAVHDVEARACKWLLRMHQLAGNDLPLTQEYLAQMMGVTRSHVTGIASALQKAGMISYSRGRIHIIDLAQIRARACECEAGIRSHYERIFHV